MYEVTGENTRISGERICSRVFLQQRNMNKLTADQREKVITEYVRLVMKKKDLKGESQIFQSKTSITLYLR